MKDGYKNTVAKFKETILDIPNITQAQRLFGDPDYLLHVVSRDLSTFQKLYDEKLSALPGVKKLTTTMIMKSVISDRLFPL